MRDEDGPVAGSSSEKPTPPDLPAYVVEPLDAQSPERLDVVARYARELAAWKRGTEKSPKRGRRERPEGKPSTDDRPESTSAERRHVDDEVDVDDIASLQRRGIPTNPDSYAGVPSRAYLTVKETKPEYRYYYWQWREGDRWKNEYVAPVETSTESHDSGDDSSSGEDTRDGRSSDGRPPDHQ